MTKDELATWLETAWSAVEQVDYKDTDWLETAGRAVGQDDYEDTDSEVDSFVNHRLTSIRYAVITQLLAKVANPQRDIIRLTSEGTPEDTAPRTIASAVVVPWNQMNDNVLGGSADPYVNNPLRRDSLLSDDSAIRSSDRSEWRRLADYLNRWSHVGVSAIEEQVLRVLKSIARRRARQEIVYPVPDRVSSVQTASIIHNFLSDPSGGLRPLIVTTALMKAIGSIFSLFTRVESQGLNEADIARNRPGDVMCYGPSSNESDEKSIEELRLVLEVKDMAITLQHIDHAVTKINVSNETVYDLLFAAPGVVAIDESTINERLIGVWRQGLDINRIDVLTLVRATTALFNNSERLQFLREIGEELDQRSEHTHRDTWRQLLKHM